MHEELSTMPEILGTVICNLEDGEAVFILLVLATRFLFAPPDKDSDIANMTDRHIQARY